MTHTIDIVAQDKRTPGIKHIEPLLHPLLPELYANRAARLRQLAEGHEQASYLRFAAQVVDAQAHALQQAPASSMQPWNGDLAISHQTEASLAADDALWATLPLVLDHLGTTSPQAEAAVAALRGQSRQALASQALRLLRGDIRAEEASQTVFLWATLSLVWASRANPPSQADDDQPSHEHEHEHPHAHGEHALCPVCGCTPTGSLILTGDRAGLRYLQCSLCETRWHMVRAKCSNCGSAAQLDYWSFDPAEQPDLPGGTTIKAESCGDCSGYLKAAYLEKDAAAEIVADDLASLALDAAVAQEGFRRTGFNPFAFPAN